MKDFAVTGGIGSIASRLTLEGPIVQDRASFMVSGRRTYADMFLALSSDSLIRNNILFFYDLNMNPHDTKVSQNSINKARGSIRLKCRI